MKDLDYFVGKRKETYKTKTGDTRVSNALYLVFDNGYKVRIAPAFGNADDFLMLWEIAQELPPESVK